MDVRHYAGGQLAEQDPESQHSPQVFFDCSSSLHFLAPRCTWTKGKMPCVELLEETEPAGWFGKATGFGYGCRQLKPFMGGLLLLKPDSTPARRFQVFKLAMDGKLEQLSEGPEEVVRIYYASPTTGIIVQTTRAGDPASRDVFQIDLGTSDENDEQYPEDLPNSDFPGNVVKKSLTNIEMDYPGWKPCQYAEVFSANTQQTQSCSSSIILANFQV